MSHFLFAAKVFFSKRRHGHQPCMIRRELIETHLGHAMERMFMNAYVYRWTL